ncbi:MAG: ATP-binding protein [Sulfurimonas sp.]|jgi:hypothetical protein
MFIGRKSELDIFESEMNSNRASFIAVYGRRRIGKTETIRHFCVKNNLRNVEFTGKLGVTMSSQLKSFVDTVRNDLVPTLENIKLQDWQDAFSLLRKEISGSNNSNEKIVLFFDEVPWLDTQKSNFIDELAYFYNNFVTKTENIILIVCGSAASYMKKKIVHNRGPLHNRLTSIVPMESFDLATTKEMLDTKGCRYSLKSILDLYIVFGGVAKYLSYIDSKKTPQENVQDIIFGKYSMMMKEYEDLFKSLFNESGPHYKIMDVLSAKWSGYAKHELAKHIKMTVAGMSKSLDELESSGFVKALPMFGKKSRETVYRASDPFSFFHNKWLVKDSKSTQSQTDFLSLSLSQGYKSWSGFAFENICFMHIDAIKKALGISGIPTKAHYWNYTPLDASEHGAQIDILLEHDNSSRNIDIIECKYYDGEFVISKSYHSELKRKIAVFNEKTKFRYNIRLVFVSVDGVARNEYFNELNCIDVTAEKILMKP